MTKQRTMYKESDLAKKVEAMEVGTYYVAPNVYLSITPSGAVNWKTRFRLNGKAIERVLAPFGENSPYVMDYSQAVIKSIDIQKHLRLKQNPLEVSHLFIRTIDDLVKAFLDSTTHQYTKEQQVYAEDIQKKLGGELVVKVTSFQLEEIVKEIVDSGRNSIAALVVGFFRNIFDYAKTHSLILKNPASHLTKVSHAGFVEKARKVTLKKKDIENVFQVFQQYPQQASLVNQCAIALFMIFGFRKSELLKAKWEDFDEYEQELTVHPTKTGCDELTVGIPCSVMTIFRFLKENADDSPYIFPSTGGAMCGHMSESTLNAMISKFFKTHQTKSVCFNDPLGNKGVPKFHVHDLRRTFSTLAGDLEIHKWVIELGLNHSPKKGEKPYHHSKRPTERKRMYQALADFILPKTNLLNLIEPTTGNEPPPASALPIAA